MDRPEYELSQPDRIKSIRDSFSAWMKKEAVELYEVNRAIALLLRESDEKRKREALEGRHGTHIDV